MFVIVSLISASSFAEKGKDVQALQGAFDRGALRATPQGSGAKPKERKGDCEHCYRVTVDYGQTIEQAVQAADCTLRSTELTSRHFSKPASHTRVVTTIKLVRIGSYFLNASDVLSELAQSGYRPANIYELLALGAQFPNLQRNVTIIALGSSWSTPCCSRYDDECFNPGSCSAYPYLTGDDLSRDLGHSVDMSSLDDPDRRDWRFAVVSLGQ